LQPVRMKYQDPATGNEFVLNLIDTPGHVDFGYEVSRSLAAVEGAVLLVDATQGVQAQTIANLYQAIEQGLEIIPVINKIDLPNADIAKTKQEIIQILGCKPGEIIAASGKTGEGVEAILSAIIKTVPSPGGSPNKPFRALIFDSKYDTFKGVLAYVRVVDGSIRAQEEKIFMKATATDSDVIEVGYFRPELQKTQVLESGAIGYVATGLKTVDECRVGDTITFLKDARTAPALSGYKEITPMVYASLYPTEGDQYNYMRDALGKLKLNDAAFTFEPESSLALGKGFRCGFLGLLHLEIVQERLKREFDLLPIITTPSVVYEVKLKGRSEKIKVFSAQEMPDPSVIESVSEPYVKLDVVTPSQFLGAVLELMNRTRSMYLNTEYLDSSRLIVTFETPLTEVIINLHDNLKSASSGFASMNYSFLEYRMNELVKLDVLVASDKVEALSRIVPKDKAYEIGKILVAKLKEVIPRQNFQVPIQAAVGGKILARETIKAFRKDVTAKLYGGDVTRKRKLLEKQKKGKKKMALSGKIELPNEVFLAALKK